MTAAVVTGIGIAAPNGLGTEAYWEALLRGDNGIAPLARYDTSGYPATLAGEVKGFEPKDHIPSRLLPQTDVMTRLSLAAAQWALDDSGVDLDTVPSDRRGVVTGATAGGYDFGQRELQNLWSKGPKHVGAYQSFAWFYAVNTGQIGIRHNMRGQCAAVVTDHAGGLDAIAQGRRSLRKGARLMLTGAVDSSLSPYAWAGHLAGGRMTTRDDPERSYLPFDEDADGYVPGEGGAILVLEDAEEAAARGADVYGEIAGYAATFDPRPERGAPTPSSGLERAVRGALTDAGLTPDDIGVVFADAAGTPDLDRAEAAALTAVFGARGVPVTAPKTLLGRLCSGGAPLDVATALLALREGVLPPTAHVTKPAFGDQLDLVTGEARTTTADTALVLARGHGGFNSALVVRRAQ
ncbi:ketosynthase chain-length factor [Streptomyces sp. SID8379]|uniref:ketosynthase chain-length factor n=1 Tax=unclassified Streptomyces TaxID=2593676 RepID=UPI00039C4CA2|nr:MULTISPECIES: ketosynthase chain-length factor [unclassified Streptomyces]MYW65841.1 ketosynthase chain-length factor [Streptomyces sp. SID8379]